MPGTISKSRRMIAYAGVLIINFMAMYLISSVGVYSYTVAGVFNNLSRTFLPQPTKALRWMS